MQIKNLFKISALTTALTLAGCGGDVHLSSNVDNSVGDTNITNPAPTAPIDNIIAGKANTLLSAEVSAALGFDVQVQILTEKITEDTTLVASSGGKPVFYAISGGLEVGALSTANKSDTANTQARNASGPTLTIEPGAVLFGQTGEDYLVVHRDAMIMAEGTKAKPIIMTSLQDVKGEDTSAGQWGGGGHSR